MGQEVTSRALGGLAGSEETLGFFEERRPDEDHHRVLVAAMMSNPSTGWDVSGTSRRTSPRDSAENCFQSRDVQPFNIGIHSAWHRAADRQQWHKLIDTAMLQYRSTPSRQEVPRVGLGRFRGCAISSS